MQKFFSFKGRSRRRDYWLTQVLFGLAYFITLIGIETENEYQMIGGIVAMLVLFIPAIAIQITRFHDINKSGLHILINFIPVIGGLITGVMLGFFGPVDYENEYGDNPRDEILS